MFGRKKKEKAPKKQLRPNPKLDSATAQLIENIVLEAIINSGNMLNEEQKQELVVSIQQAFQDIAAIDPSVKAQIIADVEAVIADFTSETPEQFIHNKQVWVNVIWLVAMGLQIWKGWVVPASIQLVALGAVNSILVYFTHEGMTLY